MSTTLWMWIHGLYMFCLTLELTRTHTLGEYDGVPHMRVSQTLSRSVRISAISLPLLEAPAIAGGSAIVPFTKDALRLYRLSPSPCGCQGLDYVDRGGWGL